MSVRTKIFVSVILVLLLVGAIIAGFWVTGGKSLVYVYQNYISKDLPDKKFSWDQFTDLGPKMTLSGYFAGSDSKGFYM